MRPELQWRRYLSDGHSTEITFGNLYSHDSVLGNLIYFSNKQISITNKLF